MQQFLQIQVKWQDCILEFTLKGVVIWSLKAASKLLRYEIHNEIVLFSDDDIAVSIRKNSYSDRTIHKGTPLCDLYILSNGYWFLFSISNKINMNVHLYRLQQINEIGQELHEEKLKQESITQRLHCGINFCNGCLLGILFVIWKRCRPKYILSTC